MAITGGTFSRDNQLLEVSFPQNTGNTQVDHDVQVSGETEAGNAILSNKAVVRQTPDCKIAFNPSGITSPASGSCYSSRVKIETTGITIDTLTVTEYSSEIVTMPFVSTVNGEQYLDFCVSANASTNGRSGSITVTGIDVYGEERTATFTVTQSAGREVTISLSNVTPTAITASETTANLRFRVSGGKLTKGSYDNGNPFTDVIDKTNNYTFTLEENPSTGDITGGTVQISFNQNRSYTYNKEYTVCVSGLSIFNEAVNGSSVNVVSNDITFVQSPRIKTGSIKLIADTDSVLYSDTSATFTIRSIDVSNIGWCPSQSSSFITGGSISGNKLTVTFAANTDPDSTRTIVAAVSGTTNGNTVYGLGEVVQGKAPALKVYDQDKTPSTAFTSDIKSKSYETSRRFYYASSSITSVGVNVGGSSGITGGTVYQSSSSIVVGFSTNASEQSDAEKTVTVTGLTANGSTVSATYKFAQEKKDGHNFKLHKTGDESVLSDRVESTVSYYGLSVTSSGVTDIGVVEVTATPGSRVLSPRAGQSISGSFTISFDRNYSVTTENVYTIRLSGKTEDTREVIESNTFTINQSPSQSAAGTISFVETAVTVEGTATTSPEVSYQFENCIGSSVAATSVRYGDGQPIQSGAVVRVNQSNKTVTIEFPANISPTQTNTYTIGLTATDARGETVLSTNELTITQGVIEAPTIRAYFTDSAYSEQYGSEIDIVCTGKTLYFVVEAANIDFSTAFPTITSETIDFSYTTWVIDETGVGRIDASSTFRANETTEDIIYEINCSVLSQDGTTISIDQPLKATHKTCRSGSKLYTYLKDVDGVEIFSETDIRKMILGVIPQTDYNNYKIPFTATTVTWLVKPEEIVYETAQIQIPSEGVSGAEAFVIRAIDENKNTETGTKDVWNGSSFESTGYTFVTSTDISKHSTLWKKSRTKYVNGEEVAVTDDTDNGFNYIATNFGSGSIQNIEKSTGDALLTYQLVEGPTTVNRVQYAPAIVDASPEGGKVIFEYDTLGGEFSLIDVIFAEGTVRPANIELPVATNTVVFTYEGNFTEGEKFTEFYLKSGDITTNPIKVRQKKLQITPALKIVLDSNTTSMDDTGEKIAKPATTAIWTVDHTGITVSTIGLVYVESQNIVSVNGTNPTETGRFSMASFLNGPNPDSTDRLIKIVISGTTVMGTLITATTQVYQSGIAKGYGLKVFAPSNITFKEQTVYLSVGSSYVSLSSLNVQHISGNTAPIIASLTRFSADNTSTQRANGYCIYKVSVPENGSMQDGDQVIFRTVATGVDSNGNSYTDYGISVQGLYVPEVYIRWAESTGTGRTVYATATSINNLEYEEHDVTARTVSSNSSTFRPTIASTTSIGGKVNVTMSGSNNTGSDQVGIITLSASGRGGQEASSEGFVITRLCKPELSFNDTSPVSMEADATSRELRFSFLCIRSSNINLSSTQTESGHFTVTRGTDVSSTVGRINVTCAANTGITIPEVTITISGTNNGVTTTKQITVKHKKLAPSLAWVGTSATMYPDETGKTLNYTEHDIRSRVAVPSTTSFTADTAANGSVLIKTDRNMSQSNKVVSIKLTGVTNDGANITAATDYSLTQLCRPKVTPASAEVEMAYNVLTTTVSLVYACVEQSNVSATWQTNPDSHFTSVSITSDGRLSITAGGENTGSGDITGVVKITYSGNNVTDSATVTVVHKKIGPSLVWTSGCGGYIPSAGGSITLAYAATNVNSIGATLTNTAFAISSGPSDGRLTITAPRNGNDGTRSTGINLTGVTVDGDNISAGECVISQNCDPAVNFTDGDKELTWDNTGPVYFNFTKNCLSSVTCSSNNSSVFTATLDGDRVKVTVSGQNTDTNDRSAVITVSGVGASVSDTVNIKQKGFNGQGGISLAASTTTIGTGQTTVYFTATTTYVAWSGATTDLSGAEVANVDDHSGGVTTPSGYVTFTVTIPAYSSGGGGGTNSFTDCNNFTLALVKGGYATGQWTHSGGSGSDNICLIKNSRRITVTAKGTDSTGGAHAASVTITQS